MRSLRVRRLEQSFAPYHFLLFASLALFSLHSLKCFFFQFYISTRGGAFAAGGGAFIYFQQSIFLYLSLMLLLAFGEFYNYKTPAANLITHTHVG